MESICSICGKTIPEHRQRRHAKSCSDKCGAMLQKKRYNQLNPCSVFTQNISGAIAEHRTIIDLLSHGFEVFHSVNPGSPCDLVILKDNKLQRVEVKSLRYMASGVPFKPTKPIKADILASVMPDKIIYSPPLFKDD